MICSSNHDQDIKLWTPGRYQIEVAGDVGKALATRLGELTIVTAQGGNKESVTRLAGCFKDQAELLGVLNNLYDLQYPVLRVERLSEE